LIYAPFFNVLYYSFNKEAWKENKKEGYKKIFVASSKTPLLVTSRSHPEKELDNFLNYTNNSNYKIKKLGSSLKFCYVAEGKAQIYPRFGSTCIWDTASRSCYCYCSRWQGTNMEWRRIKLFFIFLS
jgi:3'(2'), 5'-bisphosphate nucleotidase